MVEQKQELSPLAQMVVSHWRSNFPKEAAELQKAGEFEGMAESAAQRATLAEQQARQRGLSWSQAQELSAELWGTPPNLN